MIRFSLLVCFVTALCLSPAYCQQSKPDLGPVDVARRIFDEKGFPAMKKYITGEYDGHPSGKDFKLKNIKRTFRLLSQTDKDAVVALTLTDGKGSGTDCYLFFVKQAVWKMQAYRALAMKGFGLLEKRQLERLSAQQVDSIVAVAATDKQSSVPFSSKEEYDFKMGNAQLLMFTDDQLIAFFNEHREQFNELKTAVAAEKETLRRENTTNSELLKRNVDAFVKRWEGQYKKLFITYVPAYDTDFKNSIELVIWGMVDNYVGYVYIPDEKDVPRMSSDHIIMLRAMGDGWYLYKTT